MASLSPVQVSMEDLLALKADARKLSRNGAGPVASLFPGAYRSYFKGRGLEFDEVRGYQWGDDYRTIDWRVTARTGRMHIRQYNEERERTLHLVLDAGASMQFATRVQFKWVLVARLAALFGWLAMGQGDRVGSVVYGHQFPCAVQRPVAGEGGLRKVFRSLQTAHSHQGPARTTLKDALLGLQQRVDSGSQVVILSDFSGLDDTCHSSLAYLGSRCQLLAIQVFDPLEYQFPNSGLLPITEGHHVCTIDSSASMLQDAYQRSFLTRTLDTEKLFRHYGGFFMRASTEYPASELVAQQKRWCALFSANASGDASRG